VGAVGWGFWRAFSNGGITRMFVPWWLILVVIAVACALWHQRERAFAKERVAWKRQEDRRLEQEENARIAAYLTDDPLNEDEDETIEDWHLRQQRDPILPRG
jgi:hypothetical protein